VPSCDVDARAPLVELALGHGAHPCRGRLRLALAHPDGDPRHVGRERVAPPVRVAPRLALPHLAHLARGQSRRCACAVQLARRGRVVGVSARAVVVVVAAVDAHARRRQLHDAVHAPQQRAVVADAEQAAGPALDERVERLAAGGVEVVGRLVEEQHVRPAEREPGERDPRGLAAAHRAGGTVERQMSEAEPSEHGGGPLGQVPVVGHEVEVGGCRLARLQPPQRGQSPVDAEDDGERRLGRRPELLWQDGDRAHAVHRAGRGGQLAREQANQRRLARSVGPDETGPLPPEAEREVVKQRVRVSAGRRRVRQPLGDQARVARRAGGGDDGWHAETLRSCRFA
jgi:hypothetical protein